MSTHEFGVDEAGKGPVLGPMVAACVVADPDAVPPKIDDSKRLSQSRRETLAKKMRADERVRIGVAHITTERIDDPATDMNTLTVAAHAKAISHAVPDVDVGLTGVLDGADTDADRFARRVRERVDSELTITAEHGADERYQIVGAASVIAKVERDRAVVELSAEYGDVGSGYPSDPTTRAFLSGYVSENGKLPDCARESWKTATDALAAAEQSALDSF